MTPSTRSDGAEHALLDTRDNIALAYAFIDGMTFEAFRADRKTVYAVTRALEIISEAARRLPDSFRSSNPSLPWKKIMGAGNVYRHVYEDVEDSIVWFTVCDESSPLAAAVSAALAGAE